MTDDKRAFIAFVCGAKATPYRKKLTVLDYSRNMYLYFQILHRSASDIHVYDCQRDSHVRGSFDMLFDYGSDYYITMEWNGRNFKGLDYESQHYFMGKISFRDIEIFDYEREEYFMYQIC